MIYLVYLWYFNGAFVIVWAWQAVVTIHFHFMEKKKQCEYSVKKIFYVARKSYSRVSPLFYQLINVFTNYCVFTNFFSPKSISFLVLAVYICSAVCNHNHFSRWKSRIYWESWDDWFQRFMAKIENSFWVNLWTVKKKKKWLWLSEIHLKKYSDISDMSFLCLYIS